MSALLLSTGLGILSCFSQTGKDLPYAAPPTVLTFQEAKEDGFPYKSFIRQGNQEREFEPYGKFKFHKTDLNNDGKNEWIVAMQDDYPQGPVSIWFFEERDGMLVQILKAHEYFTIIPRKDSYPDVEDWHHNAEYKSRQRWSYNTETNRYEQMWAEYYLNDVISETIVTQK